MVRTASARRNYSSLISGLLANYGVHEAGEGRYRSTCPLGGCESGHPFVATRHGRFWCYSCKAEGRIEDLWSRLTGASAASVDKMLANLPELAVPLDDSILLPPYEKRHDAQVETRDESLLAPHLRVFPRYLLNRGFSEDVLARYDIGYDRLNQRIVIPSRDAEARLVGLTYRVDRPGSLRFKGKDIKYWHDGFDKSRHLYGLHLWAGKPGRNFFLVEGQLDTCRMFQLQCRASGVMGSSISQAQVKLIRDYVRTDRLVLAYDNDDAGLKATHQSLTMLIDAGLSRILHVLQYSGKDPGDLRSRASFRIRHYTQWLDVQLQGKKTRSWH